MCICERVFLHAIISNPCASPGAIAGFNHVQYSAASFLPAELHIHDAPSLSKYTLAPRWNDALRPEGCTTRSESASNARRVLHYLSHRWCPLVLQASCANCQQALCFPHCGSRLGSRTSCLSLSRSIHRRSTPASTRPATDQSSLPYASTDSGFLTAMQMPTTNPNVGPTTLTWHGF